MRVSLANASWTRLRSSMSIEPFRQTTENPRSVRNRRNISWVGTNSVNTSALSSGSLSSDWRRWGEPFKPPFECGADSARTGDHQTLHQDHQEADVAPLLPHGLVVAFADVFGDRLVEELLIAVSLFPGDRAKLRAPGFEQG